MNIALYGGTFDPVHLGHIAVARAAAERFNFGRVYFVPADIPPHKQKQPLTAYYHRYAMLALALAGEKTLLPSLLEAPEIVQAEGKLASYSVDTVRRFRQRMGKRDKLFFLIGIDAFQDIAKWQDPVALLRECEFVVASRPGFSLTEAAMALPIEIRPTEDITKLFGQREVSGPLVLSGAVIHFLGGIYKPESSTQVRNAVRGGRTLARLVSEPVADYIRKMHLYRGQPSELGSPGLPPQPSEPRRLPGTLLPPPDAHHAPQAALAGNPRSSPSRAKVAQLATTKPRR
jgi:nicotinate-nucleotide adenylyltransferase